MSEGDFIDIRPFNPNKSNTETDEASDAFDTIDWLTKNIPNNNGRVGVMGTSYPGFYATMSALSGHPALKAVNPQAPVTDWFMGDDFHHNGAFIQLDAFSFFSGFGKNRSLNFGGAELTEGLFGDLRVRKVLSREIHNRNINHARKSLAARIFP